MDYKNYIKKLPKQEKTILLDKVGQISKFKFEGAFTFKILNIKDQMEVARKIGRAHV